MSKDEVARLRAAAQAVVTQAEPDDNFDGEYIDYLVPFEAINALRAALSGVPEGAASEDDDVEYGEYGVPNPGWVPQRPVPSPEPLDVERLARVFFETNVLGTMFMPEARRRAERIAAEYARLAAPQPVPEEQA